jgi:hypothetical protein
MNDDFINYLDRTSGDLVTMIEPVEFAQNKQRDEQQPNGSFVLEKPVVNLNLAGPIVSRPRDINGEVNEIRCLDTSGSFRYSAKTFPKYKKFLENAYKNPAINKKVSFNFLEDKVFDWLSTVYKTKKADKTFSSYLLDEIENAIQSYSVYFLISYLHIPEQFKVGNVEIGYFTSEFFSAYAERSEKEDTKKFYLDMAERYNAKVFAMLNVTAEKKRAEEIAFEECSLAVDIMKICSNTLVVPKDLLSFDIDRRVQHGEQAKTIIQNKDFEKGLSVNLRRGHTPLVMDQQYYSILASRLKMFNALHKHRALNHRTELQILLERAISKFANALTNRNLHERLTQLFSVFESLLLVGDDSRIIDSVTKYGSKIIYKEIKNRKEFVDRVKRMYKVRSAYIHHGQNLNYDLTDLKELQVDLFCLLKELVSKTDQYTTKTQVLNEIDEAILRAY